jgi:hypothetical protein
MQSNRALPMTAALKNKNRRKTMRPILIIVLLILTCFVQQGFAAGVTEEDFKVRTTQQLMNLCTASANDPLAKEAIHFCHGYLIGAYAYYLAQTSGPDGKRLFCLPDPEPTRNEALVLFLKWVNARPQLKDQSPVETEFMFLSETWPCKK